MGEYQVSTGRWVKATSYETLHERRVFAALSIVNVGLQGRQPVQADRTQYQFPGASNRTYSTHHAARILPPQNPFVNRHSEPRTVRAYL